MKQDIGDHTLVGAVHDIGGGRAGLAHAHVQRAILHEGKAALGHVQLHRGYAKIQNHAVQILRIVVHPGKHALDHLDPVAVGPGPACRHLKGQRITVHRDHLVRPRLQQAARIAARAKGAIQPHTGHRGHRLQQRTQQNRDMGGI